ncbi:hypothetical protein GDO86_001035 [Hymenochirus boettgeri]|uniref:Immunoglobulin V-set domain-containing protein n=1 Tax=Hymenochirus boettgeri TaxID=247094 RepID=A0A8T2KC05_9PIPI|nr:hypothetical protein GDO86_001035 [Hymenochirus boettgeri]
MTPILSLYCVFMWISYTESQILSLTPSTNTVNLGQSVTFTCNIGAKDGYTAHLLKQMPGYPPQLIIYNHHSLTSPGYGPGVSTERFTSTINGAATEYQFIIKKAEVTDTAHYYCVKWFGSNVGFHSD